LPPRGRFDKQPFETPDHAQKGRKHEMGGIHEEDDSVARLGLS